MMYRNSIFPFEHSRFLKVSLAPNTKMGQKLSYDDTLFLNLIEVAY